MDILHSLLHHVHNIHENSNLQDRFLLDHIELDNLGKSKILYKHKDISILQEEPSKKKYLEKYFFGLFYERKYTQGDCYEDVLVNIPNFLYVHCKL